MGQWMAMRRLRRSLGGAIPDATVGGPITRRWGTTLLAEMGVTVEITGAPQLEGPGLFACNHMGFLDVLVWLASADCCFLGKQAIRRVPVIGWGADSLGTVWVERDKQRSRMAARNAIARGIMQEKRQLVLFPEGTTSYAGGPWRPGAFATAAEHGFPVQATGLFFDDLERGTWVEQNPLLQLMRLFSSEPITARLHFFEPVQINDPRPDTRQLQDQVHGWLHEQLAQVGYPLALPGPV
jgi:1-acyl-sn-glycerol-3-phosphate acyltransferase